MKQVAVHENFDRVEEHSAGSNRSFGVLFTIVFGLIAVHGIWSGASSWAYWAIAAVVFAGVTLWVPVILAPLNGLWMRFALLLSRITTPIVMVILFFGTVVPTGIVMRLFGKDPLRLKLLADAETYWVHRTPPGPTPESLKNQF